jgi:hypothetical protein
MVVHRSFYLEQDGIVARMGEHRALTVLPFLSHESAQTA